MCKRGKKIHVRGPEGGGEHATSLFRIRSFAEADGSSASLSELWPYAAAQLRKRTEASRHVQESTVFQVMPGQQRQENFVSEENQVEASLRQIRPCPGKKCGSMLPVYIRQIN